MKKRDATTQKGPSLKFSRVSRQTAKTRKSDFRRQNFGESHVCKENRVQNIVFLRVCANQKIKLYGTQVARRPETDFLRSRVRDKLLPQTGSPLDFGPKKKHQNTRLFKIVCFDAIESTRDFAPSDVRSASTASRSYFREQRVRDKLEPQLSLEPRVRDK